MKDRVDKNLVKENDNIRKYMQQMKVADSLTASIVFSILTELY